MTNYSFNALKPYLEMRPDERIKIKFHFSRKHLYLTVNLPGQIVTEFISPVFNLIWRRTMPKHIFDKELNSIQGGVYGLG